MVLDSKMDLDSKRDFEFEKGREFENIDFKKKIISREGSTIKDLDDK